jgi:peptidoglycan/xylan/chitin deacetylase (PgdA/CDA1 family)
VVLASRRAVLRGALLGAAGVAVGVAGGPMVSSWCGLNRPPVTGGYAAAADDLGAIHHPDVTIRYAVQTREPLVAFTFDDGPAPHWTPTVLDILDEAQAAATFFMVGGNVVRNAALVRDRLSRHEVGNHSWSHPDLATLNLRQVGDELDRAQAAIRIHLGRTPVLFRPPFGHLGGSTVLAADQAGFEVVLWSVEMHERRFRNDPGAQAQDIIGSVRPGAIILAHDTGDDRRLTTMRALPTMIDGLRRKGFRLVTVSELIAAETPAAPPHRLS